MRILAIALVVASVLPWRVAADTILHHSTHLGGGGGDRVIGPLFVAMAGLGEPVNTSANLGTAGRLFDDRLYGNADTGSLLIATRLTDPDFDAFVQRLTNGTPELIHVGIGGVVAGGYHETALAWGDQTDPRVDLQGRTIESVSLFIRLLDFRPRAEGGFDYDFDFTLAIDDDRRTPGGTIPASTFIPRPRDGGGGAAVPLPGTLWAGLALLAAVGGHRLRGRARRGHAG